MTVELFLILLSMLSVITSLFTEGVKKMLESLNFKYVSNIVVLCASIIVAGVGMIVFYLWNDFVWTTLNIICIFLMICANWLSAMLGYDKIKQAIEQIKNR